MYELIEHKKLDSAASSITFSNIPQTYTDLYLVVSARSTSSSSSNAVPIDAIINGSSSDMTGRYLEGTGSGVASATDLGRIMAIANSSTNTASTFSNSACYIPNYAVTTTAKSWSLDSGIENNATFGLPSISANLWNPTTKAAISSIELDMRTGDFAIGSSATLYGVNRTAAIGQPSRPKAIGGNITFANGYWVHTFTGSGTLIVNEDITADYLIIAGGGGSTFSSAGGAGAGGYRCSVQGEMSGGGVTAETPTFLYKNTSYPIIVGAGGAASISNTTFGGQGSDSSFNSIVSLGGGKGSGQSISYPSVPPGQPGGSGSGGPRNNNTPGAGTAGQGYAGGYGTNSGNSYAGGGGGGAGGVGGNASSTAAGNGGIGVTSNITGTAVARAGGGSGSLFEGSQGTAVAGGGVGARDGTPGTVQPTGGTANTGGGAGGGGGIPNVAAAGGSGIVIVRYKA